MSQAVDPEATFEIYIASANKHRAESKPAAENRSLASALKAAIQIAVTRSEQRSGVAALHDLGCADLLHRLHDLNQDMYDALTASGKVSAAVLHNLTPSHLACLLGEHDLARSMLRVTTDSVVLKHFPLTPFWRVYAQGFLSVLTNEPFSPDDVAAKGYEKHWMTYVDLMVAITHDQPTKDCLSAIDESFTRRNSDKRLTDWEMIDGDGKHPVSWDFRKASLLSAS